MSKNLYQMLLGIYLCQRRIVSFKGIIQPVLFTIISFDLVTPQKGNMYEACWLFTLKMAVQ